MVLLQTSGSLICTKSGDSDGPHGCLVGRIPFRDPPCPGGQVGKGASPTLDAVVSFPPVDRNVQWPAGRVAGRGSRVEACAVWGWPQRRFAVTDDFSANFLAQIFLALR